jgi:hypothetical protein
MYWLSVCLVCLPACLSVCLSICLCICQYICYSSANLPSVYCHLSHSHKHYLSHTHIPTLLSDKALSISPSFTLNTNLFSVFLFSLFLSHTKTYSLSHEHTQTRTLSYTHEHMLSQFYNISLS